MNDKDTAPLATSVDVQSRHVDNDARLQTADDQQIHVSADAGEGAQKATKTFETVDPYNNTPAQETTPTSSTTNRSPNIQDTQRPVTPITERNKRGRWLFTSAAVIAAGVGGALFAGTRGGESPDAVPSAVRAAEETTVPDEARLEPVTTPTAEKAPEDITSPEAATITAPPTTSEVDNTPSPTEAPGPVYDYEAMFMNAKDPNILVDQFFANYTGALNSPNIETIDDCLLHISGDLTGPITQTLSRKVLDVYNHRQEFPDFHYGIEGEVLNTRAKYDGRYVEIIASVTTTEGSNYNMYLRFTGVEFLDDLDIDADGKNAYMLTKIDYLDPGQADFDSIG